MKGMVLDAIRTVARRAGFGAMALITLAPALRAQDSTAAQRTPPVAAAGASTAGYRTHTVRSGETLYDIAQTYLGDGDLWPEIYRLNAGTIADPHWIYANSVLRIPAGAAGDSASSMAAAPAPARATDAAPAPSAALGAPPAAAPADAPASAATGGTMFTRNARGEMTFVTNRGSTGMRGGPSAKSAHERQGAPYLDREGGPHGAGVVLGTTAVSNVIDADDRAHFDQNEDLYITLPAGSTPVVGQRFYTYTLGQSFGDRGQIVIPTGILTVVQPGVGTDATIARVTTLFGLIDKRQGVLPLDVTPMPTQRPAHVDDGAKTKVLWVEDDVVLPTLQFYVVLEASEKQGLHVGDQITLYRPKLHVPESSVTIPESEIAVAEVVRVNGYATTAVIVASTQPSVEAGVAAKVTARAAP
jgi:nucleoid-associated protein YgaU